MAAYRKSSVYTLDDLQAMLKKNGIPVDGLYALRECAAAAMSPPADQSPPVEKTSGKDRGSVKPVPRTRTVSESALVTKSATSGPISGKRVDDLAKRLSTPSLSVTGSQDIARLRAPVTFNSNERHFHEADRHFGDGGRYPFHHEKQQSADCGVHSLNTYNHGRSPLSRDAYFDFAKGQTLQRLRKWGQGVTDTQAGLAGTGMADLAHAQTYQVGQKARYLHSELGSTQAIADRVECAFDIVRNAYRDNQHVTDGIAKVHAAMKAALLGPQSAKQLSNPAFVKHEIDHCHALLKTQIPNAAKLKVGKNSDLFTEMSDSIAATFKRVTELGGKRAQFLDALLQGGKARGQIIIQMHSATTGAAMRTGDAGLGHHFTLRWDGDTGIGHVVNSLQRDQTELKDLEALKAFFDGYEEVEYLIPDNDRDPLLQLLDSTEGAVVRDLGKDIGVGPLAWGVLYERLESCREDLERMLKADGKAVPQGRSGTLGALIARSNPNEGLQPAEQEKRTQLLERLDKWHVLVADALQDGKGALVVQHPDQAEGVLSTLRDIVHLMLRKASKPRNGSKDSGALADWKSEVGSKLTAIRDTLAAVQLSSGRTSPMSRTSDSDVEDAAS